MAFTISNDRNMTRAITAAVEGEYGLFADGLRFTSWPPYQITIKGDDFDGGMPTRIMPAFMELQRALRRAYARDIYGDDKAVLTTDERERTGLVIRLEPGSTTFGANLLPVLEALAGNITSV